MKRVLGLIILIGFVVIMLAGCGHTAGKPEAAPTAAGKEDTAQYIEFTVQYIRTDGYIDGEKYPKTVWITSVDELEEYYNANRDKYYLENEKHPYSDQTIGFLDAIPKYDDAFFKDHDLLFVLLEEGSGSIRHDVTGVKAIPGQNGKYTLQPEIDRIIPEVGTDDMAEWHIMLEVGKKNGKAYTEAVTPVITKRMADPSDPADEVPSADAVSVVGPYGQILVYIPDNWTGEACPMDSGKLTYGLYGLILKPRNAADGQIELFCYDNFAVCGTGLSTEKMILAGYDASVGTYDDNPHWDFIVIKNDRPQVVAQHTDCSSWSAEMWDEALYILDMMKFNEKIAEGGVGQFIRESENDTIAVIMEVDEVTASGLRLHLHRYDKRDVGELVTNEGYSLQVLNGTDWEDVPMIIDNAVFTDEGYTIPEDGGEQVFEINWEWIYGKLSPGTYRITKVITSINKKDAHSYNPVYPLIAQFLIAG